jgi:aryl-alcohol dehydrogenase-like predicted oxidoreductase
MRERTFGRLGWPVGEVGYGLWGMGDWTGSDDAESRDSLSLAADLGCNFFDTALAYGWGRSEKLAGELVRDRPERKLYVATKVPPLNRAWPALPEYTLEETFPSEHIRECVERSLANLGVGRIDLLQFHVWNDAWADDPRWQSCVRELKREGRVEAVGISANHFEPENCVRALETGLVDSVQVIYNVFEQAPEDVLFPLCRREEIAVIARCPLDEGSLAGTLTADSRWPDGDWRNSYFDTENLRATLERVQTVRELLPEGMSMAELALRFILSNPDVSTVIPGMRKREHVQANIAASDAGPLDAGLLQRLRACRWDRKPAHAT